MILETYLYLFASIPCLFWGLWLVIKPKTIAVFYDQLGNGFLEYTNTQDWYLAWSILHLIVCVLGFFTDAYLLFACYLILIAQFSLKPFKNLDLFRIWLHGLANIAISLLLLKRLVSLESLQNAVSL